MIAGVGPTYEIIADHGETVRIKLPHTEEELGYQADAEADPPAGSL
jgi:hypothetical protein